MKERFKVIETHSHHLEYVLNDWMKHVDDIEKIIDINITCPNNSIYVIVLIRYLPKEGDEGNE